MERSQFKLGDKVTIHVGEDAGTQGHIVGITCQPCGADVIVVRVGETLQTKSVTAAELRPAI